MKVSFAQCTLGADAYLCCPGPSFENVNPRDLKVPGVMTFGINTVYPKMHPDVWIGLDTPLCYDPKLWWEPFTKIVRGGYQNQRCGTFPIRACPRVYFADCAPVDDVSSMLDKRNHDVTFVWNGNTFTLALHVMIWMGAKYIFLVGCDFGGDKDYHDDRTLSAEQRKYNKRLYKQQVKFLKVFSEHASRYNIKLTSCTPNSPVNEFLDYCDLNEALQYSQQRVPSSEGSILHATDASQCQWKKTALDSKGVMVGVAPCHEDMIEWWAMNYLKHNKYPVVFADFGISESCKNICKKYGRIIPVTASFVEGWFRKPFAILKAPFKKILWCDVDVEVRGNLNKYFSYANDGKIGAGHDSYNPESFRNHMPDDGKLYDSGVVAVEHGNPVIVNWCEKIVGESRSFYLGDHEVLSIVLYEMGMPLNEIPKTEHRMRIEGDRKGLLTMHWTGPQGKRHIRENL